MHIKCRFASIIIWLKICQQAFSDQNSDCRSIENLPIHPLNCCSYPRFIDNPPSTLQKCANKCKTDVQFPTFSCQRMCIIKESGVFADGHINVEAFSRHFFEGRWDEIKDLSLKWQEVVKNSIKYCEDEFPTKWIEDENKYRPFYTNYVECIRKLNFLNCVDFKGNEICQIMRNLMEKCFVKNYNFLHKILFEEFYEKGGENEKKIDVTTKNQNKLLTKL